MKKPTKITLSFSVSDDDPLKKEIFDAFATLMKLLDRKDDDVCKIIDESAKEAGEILDKGGKCYG